MGALRLFNIKDYNAGTFQNFDARSLSLRSTIRDCPVGGYVISDFPSECRWRSPILDTGKLCIVVTNIGAGLKTVP